MKKGCYEKHPLYLPQENAVDCYPKVRLEAGTLHIANYLIHARGLFLIANVQLFLESARDMNNSSFLQLRAIFEG